MGMCRWDSDPTLHQAAQLYFAYFATLSARLVPWVPEAFLARFPVAAYVLYWQAARCVGLWPTQLGL